MKRVKLIHTVISIHKVYQSAAVSIETNCASAIQFIMDDNVSTLVKLSKGGCNEITCSSINIVRLIIIYIALVVVTIQNNNLDLKNNKSSQNYLGA